MVFRSESGVAHSKVRRRHLVQMLRELADQANVRDSDWWPW
jgi:hypothetical protein